MDLTQQTETTATQQQFAAKNKLPRAREFGGSQKAGGRSQRLRPLPLLELLNELNRLYFFVHHPKYERKLKIQLERDKINEIGQGRKTRIVTSTSSQTKQ